MLVGLDGVEGSKQLIQLLHDINKESPTIKKALQTLTGTTLKDKKHPFFVELVEALSVIVAEASKPNIIGRALSSAQPGKKFDIILGRHMC